MLRALLAFISLRVFARCSLFIDDSIDLVVVVLRLSVCDLFKGSSSSSLVERVFVWLKFEVGLITESISLSPTSFLLFPAFYLSSTLSLLSYVFELDEMFIEASTSVRSPKYVKSSHGISAGKTCSSIRSASVGIQLVSSSNSTFIGADHP